MIVGQWPGITLQNERFDSALCHCYSLEISQQKQGKYNNLVFKAKKNHTVLIKTHSIKYYYNLTTLSRHKNLQFHSFFKFTVFAWSGESYLFSGIFTKISPYIVMTPHLVIMNWPIYKRDQINNLAIFWINQRTVFLLRKMKSIF